MQEKRVQPNDPVLLETLREMSSAGRKPCDILREIMRRMQVGKYGEVLVIDCLAEAFRVSIADVKVVGAWHALGDGTLTDERINELLTPLICKAGNNDGVRKEWN